MQQNRQASRAKALDISGQDTLNAYAKYAHLGKLILADDGVSKYQPLIQNFVELCAGLLLVWEALSQTLLTLRVKLA